MIANPKNTAELTMPPSLTPIPFFIQASYAETRSLSKWSIQNRQSRVAKAETDRKNEITSNDSDLTGVMVSKVCMNRPIRSEESMKLRHSLTVSAVFAATLLFNTGTTAQNNAVTQVAAAGHDGQHDFDFLVGHWKFHLKRLNKRLVGNNEWTDYDGTSSCQKVLDGRAEVEEMKVESADKKRIEGLALRFYNPAAHQWSIYWANGADGVMEQNPMVGQFTNGRGEFYNQQTFEGRAIFARFTWTNTNTDRPHFEQAFSTDGGKTWETNWITEQTKEKP
jgi:hypothetical protein